MWRRTYAQQLLWRLVLFLPCDLPNAASKCENLVRRPGATKFCATVFVRNYFRVRNLCKKGMELSEELTVALPCDPRRERLGLVGLLLHPISRSETWRSLSFFQALRVLPALRDPRTLLKKPGRRAELEEKTGVRQQGNYTGNEGFSQGGKRGVFPAIPCGFRGLRRVGR